jgi:hypothetical protein
MSEENNQSCSHPAVRFNELSQVYICDRCDRVIPASTVVRACIQASYKVNQRKQDVVPDNDIFKLNRFKG